ncbi:MAG: ATP-dependent RNA helicase HrpA [Actinobacteria bacterium]|nr:ATP-dependent RNA helicase HrpA [Actinomycetota bacterium]
MTRQAPRWRILYPADLPVSGRRDDIVAALRDHQVVVVAGETGSGKTTQVPKMLLEVLASSESSGPRIAHTQPRRIAARAVAERLADELGTTVGAGVGYRVRFTDRTREDTAITVMTDGVLLASIRRDRLLRAYDAIIIDEAHERSLNIDFLLGYLAWLLPQRPDLRVVVTSATLDTTRFSEHFGGAPVIEVSGRTFPVDVRYRPYADIDEVDAVCAAVEELLGDTEGDILVFLTGEREIRDAREALAERLAESVELTPLYGRLSAEEQHRVFAPHVRRRVVLATNVAETSLTVPGIRSVVDTGQVRMSRFSTRLKVQRLPIEPISQASAAQRAGRCGRLGPGVCIRLYDEADLRARPEFTDPEIVRTNLASVLLQMATLGLGHVTDFPFLDPPDRRAVAAGTAILEEVGAIRPGSPGEALERRVTEIGRRIARLPLDPRLGRMVLQAEREGCVDDVVVIAAALAIRDPRERPEEQASAADTAHARFVDPTSDILTVLNLWDHLERAQSSLSSTRFRKQCREEFIHYLRVREWQDLVGQLRSALRLQGPGDGVSREGDAIHRSVLAGLLSHVGMRAPEEGTRSTRLPPYRGTRDARFSLWPGSALARSKPEWVVAAEMVDTGRLWGRMVARIDPAWIEPLAGALAQRSHSEPAWSSRQARAVCVERVIMLGLPIVAGRRIPYDRIDAEAAHRLFVLHALVRGEWAHHHAELDSIAEALEQMRERMRRARLPEDRLDEDALARFFASRVPETITSGRAFDAWWRRERLTNPHLLDMPEDLEDALPVEEDFPGTWGAFYLSYRFSPGDPRDGVTVHVPVAALASLPDDAFLAHVRGYREDLVAGLVRSLPKQLRKAMGPAPEAARRLAPRIDAATPRTSLSAAARQQFDVIIAPGDWPFASLPDHLRPTVLVEDAHGREIAAGKDLAHLRVTCATNTAEAIREALPHLEATGVTEWPELPGEVTTSGGAPAWPGLLAADDGTVAVRVFPSPAERDRQHPRGVARLLFLTEPLRLGDLRLDDRDKLALGRNPEGSVASLIEDASEAVARDLMEAAGGAPLTADEFAGLRAEFRRTRVSALRRLLQAAVPVMDLWWDLRQQLDADPPSMARAAYDDAGAHLEDLVGGHVLARVRERGIPDLERYLRALQTRLAALPRDAVRDLTRMEQVHRVEDAFLALPSERQSSPEGRATRADIAELRVSLWAQHLGTPHPVSEKRLLERIAACASQ